MINFGKIIPLFKVGYGILDQDIEKIHLVSKEDVASFVNKDEGIIERHLPKIQENIPLKDEVEDLFSYLKRTKKGAINNEVIMDVNEQDIKFIYYFSEPKKENFFKLKAVYLKEKYKDYTNNDLPIFAYKLGKAKCLKEKKICNSEVLNLLKDELTHNKQSYKNEFDMFITFKDRIQKMPSVKKIVKEIIQEASINHRNNIYDVINIANAMGNYFSEQQKQEYLRNTLPINLKKETITKFIKHISRDSYMYKHKRMNRELDFWLEILAQIKGICDDNTMDVIKHDIHEITKSIYTLTLVSNQNKKDKALYDILEKCKQDKRIEL